VVHDGSNDALNILQQSWTNRWNGSDLVVVLVKAKPAPPGGPRLVMPGLAFSREGMGICSISWRDHHDIMMRSSLFWGNCWKMASFFWRAHTHTPVFEDIVQYYPVLLSFTPKDLWESWAQRVHARNAEKQQRRNRSGRCDGDPTSDKDADHARWT